MLITLDKQSGAFHFKATNESGFTAVPSGAFFSHESKFVWIEDYGIWWSKKDYEWSNNEAWRFFICYLNEGVYCTTYYLENGFSVRCVKEED